MKIACIGNITFDITVYKEGFIKKDERTSYREATFTIGGPAFNASSVISKYNGDVDFYGRIGNDVFGNGICNGLTNETIDISHLIKENIQTPLSFIMVDTSDNTRTICTSRSDEDYKNPNIKKIEYDKNYNYILTDGKYYNNTKELMLENPNAKTIIDAGRNTENVIELCKIVNYIICSEDFARAVTKMNLGNEENDKEAYRKLKDMFPLAEITITLGKRGYISEIDGEINVYPAFKLEKPVVDTNAAGDIFHGAFTYAISQGLTYSDSLKFANITAALSTTRVGGRNSCPELEEVIEQFARIKKSEKVKQLIYKQNN